MANEFKIKKGLIVDGTGTVLEVRAANVPILSINDSKDGSLLAVPNADGFAILSVSGSSVEMGILDVLGNRPLVISGSKVYMTGSAYLTDLTVSGSIIQGDGAVATGIYSYAQGAYAQATGQYSHAQGEYTQAQGTASHAQGYNTIALGNYSHAEGFLTSASGVSSHAEGYGTIALGNYSHAEGLYTSASGAGSHAEGYYTIAAGDYQHVVGQFNAPTTYLGAFIHGNGTSDGDRRNLINAYGLGTNGVVEISGSLRVAGGIYGAVATTVVSSSQASTTHTLTNDDKGKIILFRNSCTASIPLDTLDLDFECTVVSVAGTSIKFITGSGVLPLLNNSGTTLPQKSSVTIRNTGTANEYLTNGGL